MRLIFVLLFTAICFTGNAMADDGQVIARNNVNRTIKKLCVDRWSESSGSKALAPFASLSEMCQCVEQEVSYAVSDELADKVIKMQIDVNGTNSEKYLSQGDIDQTTKEFFSLYQAGSRGCMEKFIRQRRR